MLKTRKIQRLRKCAQAAQLFSLNQGSSQINYTRDILEVTSAICNDGWIKEATKIDERTKRIKMNYAK